MKENKIIIAALILTTALTAGFFADTSFADEKLAAVDLKEEALISGSKVLMDDIAAIVVFNDNFSDEKLKNIIVTAAPRPAKERLIKEDYIKMRMRQNGFDDEDFLFSGKEEVLVRRKAKRISTEKIVTRAKKFITENMPWDSENVEIQLSSNIEDEIIVADTETSIEIVPRANTDYRKRIFLNARIYGEEKGYKSIPLTFVVRRFGPVVVAKRTIPRNSIITKEDVYFREEEISSLNRLVAESLEDVIGKRAKRNILSHKPIELRMIEMPPLVKRREIVNVIFESPALKLITKAEAREDGCKNEVIRVRNLDSKKEFAAVVVSDSLVKVVQ